MATWVKLTAGNKPFYLNLDHAQRIENTQSPLEIGARIYFGEGAEYIVVREDMDTIMALAKSARS